MKPPRFLLGAALLFWGWQTGLLGAGVVMAVALECARWVETKWDFSDEDFRRIWTFCAVLLLAAAVYAFTSNEGPADFRLFFENPNFVTQRNAGTSASRSLAALFRWTPMIFFLFIGAQAYSSRGGIPPETISLILRLRWKRARQLGQPLPARRNVDISYPYLALCLLAASVQVREDTSYFWGLCALTALALWPVRSRRFGLALWAAMLAVAIGLGFAGERGLVRAQNYFTSLNAEWLANWARRRFDPLRSQTELGRIGRIKMSGKIVLRLEPKTGGVPTLLREASYRTYIGRTWSAEMTTNDFVRVPETNNTTFILLPDKTNFSRVVNIACYLAGGTGLLPLPSGSGRLENLADATLQKSWLGAVFAQGPGLVRFDACYGPGPTMDAPGTTNKDRSVYFLETNALDQVILETSLKGTNLDEALRTLSRFFQEKFTYSTWQKPERWSRTNETPLTAFLLRTRSGHCEYFATAGALLLRRLHFSVRYAVGWAVHEGSGRKYVVRQRDAHAWCLVWDDSLGQWREFDPTPPSWIKAEAERASSLQFLSDFWSRVWFEFSKFRWGQGGWRQYLLWVLVPVLVLLLYQIIFLRRQRGRRLAERAAESLAWPGLDSEFYQLEARLVERGLARQPSEPLSEWLERAVGDPALEDLRSPLQELLRLHYRYRFDPQGLSRDEREELRREAKACLTQLTRRETEPAKGR
jgi:protein-glutamine gamma-glutamyltransferase